MPSFEEARRLILDNVTRLASERVGLLESLGRVTAEDIVAPWNLPACDNSAMDGYAVRWADCQQPASLRITGFVPAGAAATGPVEAGCAIKIMTGAPIPQGRDTVVPFEDAEERGNQVRIAAPVVRGQHIRYAGRGRPLWRNRHRLGKSHPCGGDQHAGFMRQGAGFGLSQAHGRHSFNRG